MGFTGTFRAVSMIRGPRTTAGERGHLFSNYKKKYLSLELATLKLSRETKAIFWENFSSQRFDSNKIFKIIIFTRGPRVNGRRSSEELEQDCQQALFFLSPRRVVHARVPRSALASRSSPGSEKITRSAQ